MKSICGVERVKPEKKAFNPGNAAIIFVILAILVVPAWTHASNRDDLNMGRWDIGI